MKTLGFACLRGGGTTATTDAKSLFCPRFGTIAVDFDRPAGDETQGAAESAVRKRFICPAHPLLIAGVAGIATKNLFPNPAGLSDTWFLGTAIHRALFPTFSI